MLRSVLSVVMGYVAIVLSTVIVVMLAARVMGLPLDPSQATTPPPQSYILGNLVLGTLCAALGGYVTGHIAFRAPMRHAFVLTAIVLVAGLVYALTDSSPAHPRWYLAMLPITGAIGVVLGGMLAAGTASPSVRR